MRTSNTTCTIINLLIGKHPSKVSDMDMACVSQRIWIDFTCVPYYRILCIDSWQFQLSPFPFQVVSIQNTDEVKEVNTSATQCITLSFLPPLSLFTGAFSQSYITPDPETCPCRCFDYLSYFSLFTLLHCKMDNRSWISALSTLLYSNFVRSKPVMCQW